MVNILEQIKQEAFEDEMEKIAKTSDTAKGALIGGGMGAGISGLATAAGRLHGGRRILGKASGKAKAAKILLEAAGVLGTTGVGAGLGALAAKPHSK